MSGTGGRSRTHSRTEPVASITTAAAGRSSDVADRQRRYLVMMAIRVACLPLAVVTGGWLRWVFIVGAVVLPYVAVVIANATRQPAPSSLAPVLAQPRAALPTAEILKDRIEG